MKELAKDGFNATDALNMKRDTDRLKDLGQLK